ncbi:sporulation protein YqfD [Lutispora saccharofermentans]|uniref:Sporulation protein YqfD n=1 Tax=Lutispora saccharofermentans TaxID=3024236 RepID=A0ABT1NHV6_9FIRM|nr:sporulation protein YqfD [Lutispora saccharofermentans]MCQ1530855.1 sporulation protein YqfD [Lutispora saccharofermentans]
MFILRLWNYFCGYAIIIIKGVKIERFINLAVVNGIYIWDIEKIDYTTIKAKINLKDFSRLRTIVRKTDSNIKIIEKCGVPFKMKTVKKRKWFFFGLGALFVFLYLLSSYIWMIEIHGLKSLDEQAIIDNLNIAGLRVGISKRRIDKREIENSMLIKMPDLTWIGLEIKGTKAFVTIVEKGPKQQPIGREEPCDIVAAKNGVIEKILVLNGDGMVKDGDTVQKGQVLVSGTIIRGNLPDRYVHSIAEIQARTWYEEAEEIPFEQIEYKKTGKAFNTYAIEIIKKKYERNKKIPFEEYNKSDREIYLLNFGSYVFPIKLIITRYEELKPLDIRLNEDMAKARCEERLNARIKLQIPEDAAIIESKIDYFVNEKSVIGKIYVEALENIGTKAKIN